MIADRLLTADSLAICRRIHRLSGSRQPNCQPAGFALYLPRSAPGSIFCVMVSLPELQPMLLAVIPQRMGNVWYLSWNWRSI